MATLGFSTSFLSQEVPLPTLSDTLQEHAFRLDGTEEVRYTHFSLALNKIRRFAFWVAWNIDGGRLRKLSRKNIRFVFDPRVPDAVQVGDDLYADNRLDRGHIARRADLLWGSETEAKKANKDSFFFTNITPQMDDFNQSSQGGLWGQLEDAVFADVDVENLRVSLFGGPVFKDDDRVIRGVPIPTEFWKVIAFVENGTFKAKAFVLTQNLAPLGPAAPAGLELDRFRVFQVSLAEIEQRCGLQFAPVLTAADTFGQRLGPAPGPLSERKPIQMLSEIDWS
jgi:endonuclease G, mitochondrial